MYAIFVQVYSFPKVPLYFISFSRQSTVIAQTAKLSNSTNSESGLSFPVITLSLSLSHFCVQNTAPVQSVIHTIQLSL